MSTVASSNNGAPAPGIESGSVALEGQALTDAIIFQVEYYLSRENLSRDGYLQSQMDEEQFVKIDVLAQFKKLKTLSSDVEVIATALRGSRLVELDASGQRVKPRPRPQRNTIILREIPSSAPIESVMALFNGEGAPKVVEVRAEVGDNWFVVLENEEMALNALNWLRGQTYMDEPVRARMKTESTMLRSYFTGGGGGPRQPVVPFIPGGQQVPYYGAPMYNNNNNWAEFTPSGQQQQQMQMQQQMGQQQQQHHQQGQHNGRYQGNKYEGRRGDRGDRGGYRRKSSPTRGGVMVSNGSGGGKGKKKGGNNGNSQQQQRPVPEPELTMAQFPPLHNDGSAKGAAANTAASSSVAGKDSATAVAADDSTGAQNASGVAGTAGSRPGGYGSRKIVRHSPEYIARIAQQSGAGPERPAALAKRLEGLTSGPLLPVDAKPLEGLVGITSQPLAVNSKPAPATAPSKQVWGPNAKEAIAAAPKGKPRPSPNASPVKKPASPAGKSSNNNNGGAAAASNAGPSSAAPAAATSAAQPKKEEKRPAAPAPEAAPTKAPATSASAAPGPKSWAQIAKKTAQPKKR